MIFKAKTQFDILNNNDFKTHYKLNLMFSWLMRLEKVYNSIEDNVSMIDSIEKSLRKHFIIDQDIKIKNIKNKTVRNCLTNIETIIKPRIDKMKEAYVISYSKYDYCKDKLNDISTDLLIMHINDFDEKLEDERMEFLKIFKNLLDDIRKCREQYVYDNYNESILTETDIEAVNDMLDI